MQQPKIDITKTTAVVCSECENDVFMPMMKFRRMSKLINGSDKDSYIPVEVFVCSSCGNINKEFDFSI